MNLYKFMSVSEGFSLIELLVILSLIAILLVIVIPSQGIFLHKEEEKMLQQSLLSAIRFSYTQAARRNVPVIFCQSVNHKSCSEKFSSDYIVLADQQVIYIFNFSLKEGMLHWHSALGQEYIEFSPLNFVQKENGTFFYCKKNAENPAWAIKINHAGRARLVYPDPSGELKDARGERLIC